MGYGYTEKQRKSIELAEIPGIDDLLKTGKKVQELKSHPNYEDKVPFKGETKIQFTLRWIAHLVSPPQYPQESSEIECVDLRDAILAMENEINKAWQKRKL